MLRSTFSDQINAMGHHAKYFLEVAMHLFQLMKERLHETSVIQCQQNALMEMLMALVGQSLPLTADNLGSIEVTVEKWKVFEEETHTMEEAMRSQLAQLEWL